MKTTLKDYPNPILQAYFESRAESMEDSIASAAENEVERINKILTDLWPSLRACAPSYCYPAIEPWLRECAKRVDIHIYGGFSFDVNHKDCPGELWDSGPADMEFDSDIKTSLTSLAKDLWVKQMMEYIDHHSGLSKNDEVAIISDSPLYFTETLNSIVKIPLCVETYLEMQLCSIDDALLSLEYLDYESAALRQPWIYIQDKLPPDIACLLKPYDEWLAESGQPIQPSRRSERP